MKVASSDHPRRSLWITLERGSPSTYSLTSILSSGATPMTRGVFTPSSLSLREAWYSRCSLESGERLNFLALRAQIPRRAHFRERTSEKCLTRIFVSLLPSDSVTTRAVAERSPAWLSLTLKPSFIPLSLATPPYTLEPSSKRAP